MRPRLHHGVRRERGVSLMIALIFLMIMAMLGVTVANVTTLQERMAGHTRDRDLALQAAEAALRDAEAQLVDATFRSSAVPFVATNANDAAFWDTCFGPTAPSPCGNKRTPTGANALPTTGAGAVAAQPQYIVERKPDAGSTQVYRITARAVGGTIDTVVILQSEFGFTP